MADCNWSPSYNQDNRNLRWWPFSWTVSFVSSLHSKKEPVFLIKCVSTGPSALRTESGKLRHLYPGNAPFRTSIDID